MGSVRLASPKTKVFIWTLLCLLPNSLASSEWSDYSPEGERTIFQNLSLEHASVCISHQTCDLNFEGTGSSPCCYSCTCEPECVKHGSCCLRVHQNFQQARDSLQNSRYSCVRIQFLPPEETEFDLDVHVWMIVKCNPEFSEKATKEQCESPDISIDFIVPVTDPSTSTTYKNKYCALCNNINENVHLINWKLRIYSNHNISVLNENLLAFIRETRSNIEFIPPRYIEVPSCRVPPYTITTCNETGLWPEYMYDRNIETACHSFSDPFNDTYRNYFCFLCNTAENISAPNWECRMRAAEVGQSEPGNIVEVDVTSFKDGGTRDKLMCGSKQFEDDKMMVCRDVFCKYDQDWEFLKKENEDESGLFMGRCYIPRSGKEYTDHICLSVFMSLTPLSAFHPLDNFQHKEFTDALQRYISELFESWATFRTEFLTFSHVLKYVENLVIYALFDFEQIYDMERFNEAIIQKHEAIIELCWGKHEELFTFKLHMYKLIKDIDVAKIFILTEPNVSAQELTAIEPLPEPGICDDIITVPLHKLTACPYIELRLDEISVKIQNDFLIFTGRDDLKISEKIFTKWEYEKVGEKLLICLEDYIEIYANMSKLVSDEGSYTSAVDCHLMNVFLITVCLLTLVKVL